VKIKDARVCMNIHKNVYRLSIVLTQKEIYIACYFINFI